jgi:pyruvate kinase
VPPPPVAARSSPDSDAPRHRLAAAIGRILGRLRSVEATVPLSGFGDSDESARNLVHYLALRHYDLRRTQSQLADLGLSSLGRAEGHVLYNLEAVLAQLGGGGPRAARSRGAAAITPEQGRQLLARRATRLLGPSRPGRSTRIMVTAPPEAARSATLLAELLRGGMDCLRINCAHDSPREWAKMIRNLRTAVRTSGRSCRVEMDLGGPRVRTTGLAPGPAVIKLRPARDAWGRVVERARVELVPAGSATGAAAATGAALEVPADWLARRRRGERIRMLDARGASRVLRIDARSGRALVGSTARTTYMANGLRLDARTSTGAPDRCRITGIPARPGRIRLVVGDRLRLAAPSGPEDRPNRGARPAPARLPTIGVSLPAVLDRIRRGDHIWFDGGRIGGVVLRRTPAGAVVRIDRAAPGGAWLRGDQGINLPDTDLGLPALTAEDRANLAFVADHADLVGYSFVQSPTDVPDLRDALARLGHPDLGIVLKIETRRAFDHLPAILLSGLRAGPVAVMVARGDLAVEVGFERLSEVQEEILWLCEAAHLPAIWATEVLESLSRSGVPSRAEVTDAAMGERAECVMLNKGAYLVETVRALDSILRRMEAHQAKKSARLRHLRVAERFLVEQGLGEPPARPSARRWPARRPHR